MRKFLMMLAVIVALNTMSALATVCFGADFYLTHHSMLTALVALMYANYLCE